MTGTAQAIRRLRDPRTGELTHRDGHKHSRLLALLVGGAVFCASMVAATWESADARGSHGGRSHASVGRASGGFFGHRASGSSRHAAGHRGGYRTSLRSVRSAVVRYPSRIRAFKAGTRHTAKVHRELRAFRSVRHHRADGIRQGLDAGARPAREADKRRAFDRLSGDEKAKIYQRASNADAAARARESQERAQRQRQEAQYRKYYETERRNQDLWDGGGGGGAGGTGITVSPPR